MSKPKIIKSYAKNYRDFVELERKAEMERHHDEIRRLSPQERQKRGRALLGLRGKDGGRGLGGTFLVKFSPGGKLPDLEISVGDLVIVTTGRKPSGKEPSGTVTAFTGYSITVAFGNKPPSWMYKKGLRLDLFVNDITYQRMLDALKRVPKHDLLTDVLTGKAEIKVDGEEEWSLAENRLNDDQQEAVRNALNSETFHLLHGPPGTGKTTTIAEIIRKHVGKGDKVLATADSNTAVDNLVEKLLQSGVSVIRTGHPARTAENLIEHSLDYNVQEEEPFKEAQKLRERIDEIKEEQRGLTAATGQNRRGLRDDQIRKLAREGKGMRGIPGKKVEEMNDWLNLQEEVASCASRAEALEKEAVNNILDRAEVVCATNSGAGSDVIGGYLSGDRKAFDVAVVDEATQSTEPGCLIPLVHSKKFYLAGDHKQLPPTVLHPDAQQALQFSLFERLLELYGDAVKSLLTRQYRMNTEIMEFPSRSFYDGALEADPSVAEHTIAELLEKGEEDLSQNLSLPAGLLSGKPASVFFSTEALDDPREKQYSGSYSKFNPEEAAHVLEWIAAFKEAGLKPHQIGVISPYDDQTRRIKDRLEGDFKPEVKTVDGFQGREKEVIIISFVRSNAHEKLGFLTDLRRLNVAITRARRKLIMVGDAPNLSLNDTYKKLIESVECRVL